MAKKVFKMEKWLKWAKDIGMTEDAIQLQVDTWVHAFDNTPPELAKKTRSLDTRFVGIRRNGKKTFKRLTDWISSINWWRSAW